MDSGNQVRYKLYLGGTNPPSDPDDSTAPKQKATPSDNSANQQDQSQPVKLTLDCELPAALDDALQKVKLAAVAFKEACTGAAWTHNMTITVGDHTLNWNSPAAQTVEVDAQDANFGINGSSVCTMTFWNMKAKTVNTLTMTFNYSGNGVLHLADYGGRSVTCRATSQTWQISSSSTDSTGTSGSSSYAVQAVLSGPQ